MFTPSQPGPREVYTGSITKFGLDIGDTTGGEIIWAVFPPSNKRVGALAGQYGGASAEATVGAGVGANVLVGGSNRTVTLQRLSVQGHAGLNLAVGIAGLELRPHGKSRPKRSRSSLQSCAAASIGGRCVLSSNMFARVISHRATITNALSVCT